MSSTSFQKKSRPKGLNIVGCRPSIHNNQLLVSTGIPSFDNVIGGGLAVGTILLIEEDAFANYSHVMLKYCLAEGIMTGQPLYLASASERPESTIKELPGPIMDDPGDDVTAGTDQSQMKIAWRYQHLPQQQSNVKNVKFGHYYDLTKMMDSELINSSEKNMFYLPEHCPLQEHRAHKDVVMNVEYASLLSSIKSVIEAGNYGTAIQQQQRRVLRIGIQGLGGPLWGEGEGCIHSLPRFLYALRGLLRSSFATCVITMPSHLFQDTGYTRRLERLCDTVVRLEAFAGSSKEKNPAFKEYHGLFHIVRLPRLNSMICHMPDTLELAFKLKKKKFMIEKLHLPPELSETASRNQEDPLAAPPGSAGCGSTLRSSKLDF